MTHLLLWPDVVVDRWIWPQTFRPAPWQTPKAGDACESGSTEKQQAGYPSLGREAQRVLTSASPWS